MPRRLFGAKPLSKPMMISQQPHLKEQISIKIIAINLFPLTKLHLKLSYVSCYIFV